MNILVKFRIDNDGDIHTSKDWHVVVNSGGSNMSLCTGEVFGFGDGIAEGSVKQTKRGGITCINCLSKLRQIKSIKL